MLLNDITAFSKPILERNLRITTGHFLFYRTLSTTTGCPLHSIISYWLWGKTLGGRRLFAACSKVGIIELKIYFCPEIIIAHESREIFPLAYFSFILPTTSSLIWCFIVSSALKKATGDEVSVIKFQ